MPGYNIDPRDPMAVARVLIALTKEKGGEIRLRACDYDTIEQGYALLFEYDRATSEIVLRVSNGKIAIIPAENQAWLRPKEEVPIEREKSQAQQEVIRRSFRSDEELAELEEALNRKQTLAREVNEGKGTKFRTVPPTTQA
jgi:hypothetical protein